MTKQEIRQEIRDGRAHHPWVEAANLRWLLDCDPHIRQAKVIMAYSSLPDEVPLELLFPKWMDEGKIILMPRVTGKGTMEVARYLDVCMLKKGAFYIYEPTGEAFTDLDKIDVAVVPGMAFDSAGHRLGRGKGYYDRFLAQLPHTYKIGMCYRKFLLDHVPTEPHDINMDYVVATERVNRNGCQ